MILTPMDWVYGIAQLAAAFLSIIAGMIALSLFNISREQKLLKSWKYLIVALVLFTIEEILGALKTFGVYSTPHLTHVVPFFILIFLIIALVKQININRGWFE